MSSSPPIRFGVFEANPASGELTKSGIRIRLQEQPFRLLALLLTRPGEIVTREELQQALWPDAEYGEFEQGLNTAIKKVRQALGDSAENPIFIETVPRKGYRFLAPVHLPEPPPPPPSRRPHLAAVGVGALAAVVLGALWMPRPAPPAVAPQPTQITSFRGYEREPSFSPDAREIAFSWNGENEDNFDIYAKPLNAEKPVRLTTHPSWDFGPSWSPDGQRIAFGRELPGQSIEILLIPAKGGPEIKLAVTRRTDALRHHPLVSWSPDSRWLAFSDTSSECKLPCIQALSVDTGERRRITTPSPNSIGDHCPAFSADGKFLAFLRSGEIARRNLFVVPLGPTFLPTAQPRNLDEKFDGTIAGIAWLPGNRQILAAKPWRYTNAMQSGLWVFDISGQTQSLPFAFSRGTSVVSDLTVSPTGQAAFALRESDENIWRVSLDARGHASGPATALVASTTEDTVPQFSPDGQRIVFISKRGGANDLWLAQSDGTNPVQLTRNAAAGAPSWSPDGSHLVFDSLVDTQYEVYSILAAGGPPQRLTNNKAVDGVAAYSPDGRWIYFMSNRNGTQQIWRMRPDGQGANQVTKKGGYLPLFAKDGKTIYYFNPPNSIWQMPLDGGEETEVLKGVLGFLSFAVSTKGIYYIPSPTRAGHHSIQLFDFATQQTTRIIERIVSPNMSRLAVSPDERTLLWGQDDKRGSDLLLVSLPTSP